VSQYASPYQALCELVNPLRIYGDVLNFEDGIRLGFIKWNFFNNSGRMY